MRADARQMAGRQPRRALSGWSQSPDEGVWQARRRGWLSEGSREEDLRSLEVEAEPHFFEADLGHRCAKTAMILRVEHQEAAATRSDELASDGAMPSPQLVPLVDLSVGH